MHNIRELLNQGNYAQAYALLIPIVSVYVDTPTKMPDDVRTTLSLLINADLDAGNITIRWNPYWS